MKKIFYLLVSLSLAFPIAARSSKNNPTKDVITQQENQNNDTQTRYIPGIVHHINSEEEFNEIIKLGNVVIDFYADWCNPCKRLAPILDALAKEFQGILFFKANFDIFRRLSDQYKVRGIPTLIFFKKGQKVEQLAGLRPKNELADLFARAFEK